LRKGVKRKGEEKMLTRCAGDSLESAKGDMN